MTRPVPAWRRRLTSLLGGDASGRATFSRSALLPFFPSAFRGTPVVKCPGCGSENPATSARCRRCRLFLPVTSAVRRGPTLPVRLVAILVLVVAAGAFWLGLESGRQTAQFAQTRVSSAPASDLLPGPRAAQTPATASAVDPAASSAGLTWAIYTSQDRLTDAPLFGARFGTVSGTPLFTVLCAEGRAALALKRGLLPAAEGASGSSTSALETIRVGVRIGERARDPVELRFEDRPPEWFEAVPERPLEFLRRVAASRRVRTATDDFDPTAWGDAITRVTRECRFDERPASAPTRAKARR